MAANEAAAMVDAMVDATDTKPPEDREYHAQVQAEALEPVWLNIYMRQATASVFVLAAHLCSKVQTGLSLKNSTYVMLKLFKASPMM